MSMNFNNNKPTQSTHSKVEKWVFIGATVLGVVVVGGILFDLIPSIPSLFK